MDAYKDDRYSGFFGGARWLKDKLFGMPSEVNVFYADGRAGYLTAMDAVIGQVADIVGGELNAARLRIAQGRAEVRDYVTELPADLQKVGKDAEGKLDDQFDQLSSDVDNKQDALVDTLAQKYVQSRDTLDSRIEELKAANRGLVAKALDAVVGVVKTILKLKDMLLNVLSKAADVIGDIITDPIGFLGNLVDGVKDGPRPVRRQHRHPPRERADGLAVRRARRRRHQDAEDVRPGGHLRARDGGARPDLPQHPRAGREGRGRAGRLEDGADRRRLQDARHRGPGRALGLGQGQGRRLRRHRARRHQGLRHRAGDQGRGHLAALAPQPGRRVHQGVQGDLRHRHVHRRARLGRSSSSSTPCSTRSARSRAASSSVAAEKVEGALAKALPLAIWFLASLLGLGGITEKIKEGIDKVRKPIEKAVDFVVMGAVKGFKKVFGGAVGWVKDKASKGKAWVKDKATAAKEWGAGKVQGVKDRLTGGGKEEQEPEAQAGEDARTPEQKQHDVDAAVQEVEAERKAAPLEEQEKVVKAAMPGVKSRYRLKSIELVQAGGGKEHVKASINPDSEGDDFKPELGITREQFSAKKAETPKPGSWDATFFAEIEGERVTLGYAHVKIEEGGRPAEVGPSMLIDKDNVTYKGKPASIKTIDFALTAAALEEVNKLYKDDFGNEPEKLTGSLSMKNLRYFQQQYAAARKKNPMGENDEWEQAAIRAVPFGTHREAVGYSEFEVKVGPNVKVDLGTTRDGVVLGEQYVPSTVHVTARKP